MEITNLEKIPSARKDEMLIQAIAILSSHFLNKSPSEILDIIIKQAMGVAEMTCYNCWKAGETPESLKS